MPRLAPSPMTLARSSIALARSASFGGIADVGLALRRSLDVGADAAEPQQIDRALEDRVDQGRGIDGLVVEAKRLLRFCSSSVIDFSVRG